MLTKEQFLKDAIDLHIRTKTKEIFWKVVDKLIELGFEPYGNNTREHLWFAKYILLYNGDASIHPRPSPDGKKEIQVSDILGSDYYIDKPQFEVGKWCKILNNWWGKFETIHNSGKRIKFSEVITCNGEYKNEDTHIDYISDIKLLTDLSEIQQYLPDGHPDKLSKLLTIDDLVEGEVYFAECGKEEWNSLFYCKTPPRFTARLYISDKYNGKRYDPGDWGFTKDNKYRLATSEEKQWLNVCISEGKFVEKDYALRDYNTYGEPLKSEVDEEFQEGSLIKGAFYNLPGYAIFEAGKDGYIGNGGKDWRPYCDNNWPSIENSVIANPLEKKWVITCRKQKKFIEQSELDKYDSEGNLIEIKEEFKVGDWVYAERQSDGDFRHEFGDSYIPIFKVEEIYKSTNKDEWLRPIKNKANGIESKYCRLATPEEIAKVNKPVNKPFEFNKWYKFKGQPNYLAFIHKNGRYGFNTDGDWFDQKEPDAIEHFNKHKDSFVLAEDSEVKERLLSYAKEKYPTGTMFKSALKNDTTPSKGKVKSVGKLDIVVGRQVIWNSTGIGFLYDDGKWAEVISKPKTKESKEMQLSDLKNPVFNIGDRVRVIANSLKEFNSSWGYGNNSTYRKGYEGLITKIKETKSGFEEIKTWYCLDNNSNGISCNLLELVEPVKKEFDRNWYVEINSQEEADLVFDWLESQGEKIDRKWNEFSHLWKYIVIMQESPIWVLTCNRNCYDRGFIEKQLSDILPEYKQPIRTKAYHIIDTNEDLRNEIQCLINQRDFKSSDFAEPIIIKSKKQKKEIN